MEQGFYTRLRQIIAQREIGLHPAVIKQQARKNRPKMTDRERQAKYRANSPEKVRDRERRYQQSHREQINKKQRNWYDKHKDDPEFKKRKQERAKKYREKQKQKKLEQQIES